jgi:hypothetical protein
MSILEWTLMELNEHGIMCNETPMGTFLSVPIHFGFPLKRSRIQ